MSSERYALIGLGRVRSTWLVELSLWANSGAMPADFAKCVSVGEVHQKLQDLRTYSAFLVEAGMSGVDRDLIALASRSEVPVIVVDGTVGAFDHWTALGAVAVLSPAFSPTELLVALSTHARPVRTGVEAVALTTIEGSDTSGGALVGVCGAGGTGASTIAAAIAEGFSIKPAYRDLVLLADCARNGEQAMLHDAGDIMPGIEDLVESSRGRGPDVDAIRDLTFDVPTRGYRLLLGQRRTDSWSAMPPRAVESAVTGLRRAFRLVVADITGDFEGERDGGSVDVEERNAFARTVALHADTVVVVGSVGTKGTHALGRLLRELVNLGVDRERLLPVFNRAPRRGLARAEMTRALATIAPTTDDSRWFMSPAFLPEKPLEHILRDVQRLPATIVEPITSAVATMLERQTDTHDAMSVMPITPGSLGFLDDEADR